MSTNVRSCMSATRGELIFDPLYLQQGEHSCKFLYICNKGNTHVRSSISATRGALMQDSLYTISHGLDQFITLYFLSYRSSTLRSQFSQFCFDVSIELGIRWINHWCVSINSFSVWTNQKLLVIPLDIFGVNWLIKDRRSDKIHDTWTHSLQYRKYMLRFESKLALYACSIYCAQRFENGAFNQRKVSYNLLASLFNDTLCI